MISVITYTIDFAIFGRRLRNCGTIHSHLVQYRNEIDYQVTKMLSTHANGNRKLPLRHCKMTHTKTTIMDKNIGLCGTYYASTNARLLKYCLLNKHWSKSVGVRKQRKRKISEIFIFQKHKAGTQN